MANIVLDTFDVDVTLSEMAILKGKIFLLKGVDACAVYEMSVQLLRSMFLYETNAEFHLSTIKYYTHYNPDFYFNPANAQLNNPKSFGAIATADSNGLYSSDKMTLKYDFVRYLSLKLFNTINAVDLFVNLDELLYDITEKLNVAMRRNIKLIEQTDCIYGTHPELRTNTYRTTIFDHILDQHVTTYLKYMDDDCDRNICRELLLQLLKLDSSRFNHITNTNAPRSLPFESGDSINFKISVRPAPNQCLLTGVPPIMARTYQIKIVLTDEAMPIMPIIPCKPTLRRKKRVAYAYNPQYRPAIVFRNINQLSMMDYYDFVLFRYNIIIADQFEDRIVYRYISGLLQIYPKAFTGVMTTCGSQRFGFNNEIDSNSSYQNVVSHGHYGRMFYLQQTKDFGSDIHVHISKSGCFEFELTRAENQRASINIELINPGKLTYEAITTKYFDINIL